MSTPCPTTQDLIRLLQQYPPETPIYVEGYENGFDTIHSLVLHMLVTIKEPEAWDGQAQKPSEAGRDESDWGKRLGSHKVPDGEPFQALVLLGARGSEYRRNE